MISADALAYTPDSNGKVTSSSGGADLAAVLKKVLAAKKKAQQGVDINLDGSLGGVDLLTLTPAGASLATGAADLASALPPVSGDLGFNTMLGGVGVKQPTLGGVMLDPGVGISPGGDADGPSVGIGAGTPAALDTTSGVNPAFTLPSVGPINLALSPFGFNASLGTKAGTVGVNASPLSGVNLALTAPSSTPKGVNLALGILGKAAGIPTTLQIAQGLAPALAGALGPFGLAITGFNTMIELAEAVAKAADVQTVQATLQNFAAVKAMLNSPTLTADARANLEMELAVNQQALQQGIAAAGLAAQGVPSVVSQAAAALAGLTGFALQDGNIAVPAANPSGMPGSAFTNTQGQTVSGYSGLPSGTNLGSGPGNTTGGPAPNANTDPADVSQVVDLGGDAGGGGGTPGGGSGPGGVSDGGQSPYLATWAMDGLGIGPGERKERGWAAFYASFMKRFPLTGESQFRRYARLARQVVAALEKRPLPEQMQARQMIYRRIVAPLGERLELHEVDEAWTAMRAVALDLARRLGLRVDPADVPRPLHEVAARARKLRDERRVKARARREDSARA